MTSEGTPAGPYLLRLDRVEPRLAALASTPPPTRMTDPDPSTGQRWEWGQVWAHLAEFVPYWLRQMEVVLAAPGPAPAPFGRTKADEGRIAAIERDRRRPPSELWSRLHGHLSELRRALTDLRPEAWSRQGEHPTLGVMDLEAFVEEYLVGHLEQHAQQLDGMAAA